MRHASQCSVSSSLLLSIRKIMIASSGFHFSRAARISVALFCLLALLGFTASAQSAYKIQTSEFQVTFDSGGHSTPMIGMDSMTDLIVYSDYPVVNGVPGNASIYYQRVGSGAPFGQPITVAGSPGNQWLDDVSGDNIVYTLTTPSTPVGNIILYQIDTAQTTALTTAGNAWEPRIYGDYVVWIEIQPNGAGQAVMHQISSGATGQNVVMAGPSPSVADVVVGDRFVVWSQYVNGRYVIAAYDMQKGQSLSVASDAQANLRAPSTTGSWIAYQSYKINGSAVDIDAINIDTNDVRTIASNGAANQRPHISGDLLVYESNVLGNWQIFAYRMVEGDTFRLTNTTYDEHLNDVFGNLVTYVDSRNGNDGVFAASLAFVPTQAVTANLSPVNFGKVNVGASSTQNVTLNINTALTISSITAGGDYSIGPNSCVATYSAASLCAVPVTYAPTKPGQAWVPLMVTDSSNNNYSFGLEGTGIGSAVAFTPGIIGTIAGSGTACPDSTTACGDGGPANSAELSAAPSGVTLDAAGNIYIADEGNSRIRVVNTQTTPITVAGVTIGPGNIATVVGNGTSGNTSTSNGPVKAITAELYYPTVVSLDGLGNIYVADTDNMLVRKVDVNGNMTTIAGAVNGYGCANATDNVADGCPATSAYLSGPSGLAVDAMGNIYIADWGDARIRKIDVNGIITTFAGNGTAGYSGDGGPATSAELQYPSALAFDGAGNLYIADSFNNVIRKVNTSGIITTVAGNGSAGYSGDGAAAAQAQLNQPMGVAVDSAGDLYIADTNNYYLRKVDANGIISTIAGVGSNGASCSFGTYIFGDGCPATSAFFMPWSVAVDGTGDLYVADYGDSRIRKVNVTTSLLSFGTLNVDATSGPQAAQVSNVGNASLNFSSTNAFVTSANFQLQTVGNDCAAGGSLLPGADCMLGVVFAPTTAGNPVTGTLTVNDNASNPSQTVQLTGVAQQSTPTISWATPAAISYGTPLSIAQLNATASVPGTFVYTPAAGTILGAGTQTLAVTFKPTDSVDYTTATATVILTVSRATPSVTFTGAPPSAVYGSTFQVVTTTNASTTALITASGACSINSMAVTMSSGTGTCTLTASWAADTNYVAASATQTTAAAKAPSATAIVSNTPNPAALGQTVLVAFTVAGSGSPSGTVAVSASTGETCTGTIAAGSGNCSLTFVAVGSRTLIATYSGDLNFSGSVSSPVSQVVNGQLARLTPASVNFGNVYLGFPALQTVTLTNVGNASMSVGKVQVSNGNDSDDFIPVSSCPATLAAGKSCQILIGFWADGDNYNPTAVLSVTDNAPGSPQAVPLSATVINPQARLSSYTLNFGQQPVGSTSAAQTITLTNTGTTPLVLASLAANGDFALASGTNCAIGGSLPSGAHCLINVTFTPTTKGSRSGNITVKDNALAQEQVILLQGTGI
ncbi:MAG TPA: choice-of-anchor D domain-containing protein [Candidatus Sulfotelmatobacter sp.]|nr:choice-of-anchor D domain-containing protein [Candidatus Sulfotelmatobacter sp.]